MGATVGWGERRPSFTFGLRLGDGGAASHGMWATVWGSEVMEGLASAEGELAALNRVVWANADPPLQSGYDDAGIRSRAWLRGKSFGVIAERRVKP